MPANTRPTRCGGAQGNTRSMRSEMNLGMKILLVLTIITCLLLAASAALAGRGYDACRQEENRLRADEADLCSGMGYLFNPSACINARKALAPYAKGKCRDIAAREGVEEQRVEPVNSSPATPPPQPVGSIPDTPGVAIQ